MAEQSEEKQSDAVQVQDKGKVSLHAVRKKLLLFSGWPAQKSNIPAVLAPPKVPDYYKTEAAAKSMSSALAAAGLACALNTPTKINKYATDMVSGFPAGQNVIAYNQNQAKDYAWSVTKGYTYSDAVKELLSDKYLNKFSAAFQIKTSREEDHSKSTSLGSIQTLFRKAGVAIGHLQGGASVNAGDIGNFIADAVGSLVDMQGNDWESKKADILFVAEADKDNPDYVKSVGAVWYHYVFTVNDFKNKKEKYHATYYLVETKSVIFHDVNLLTKMYHDVTGGDLK